jgi:NADPH2:quinone reductase
MSQNSPIMMQAVQQDEPNGKLALREIPVPNPRAGEVLIRMSAAPINPSDLGSLSGLSYSGERSYPFVPGIEGSGTVVSVGEGLLPRYLKERRVACSALTNGNGTWAEYMATSAKLCSPLGNHVSLEQGAMQLVNPLTALAFFEIAKKEGHRAIVSTAAASALGGMILRLGKHFGIPIIHIVRRQEQVDEVKSRGGEVVLDSSDENFLAKLRALANQIQATLFLDAIGGQMTKQLTDAAPFGSAVLLYGRLSDQDSVLDPRKALVNNLQVRGWFLSNWLREKNFLQTLQLSRRAQSLSDSLLQSPIHKKFPLSEAQEALEMYVADMGAGKNLLVANTDEIQLNN